MTTKGDEILRCHFFFFLYVGLSLSFFTRAGNGQKVLNSQKIFSDRCFTAKLLRRQGHRLDSLEYLSKCWKHSLLILENTNALGMRHMF